DRLLHDELVDALGARRDDASIRASPLLGEPVNDVAAGEDFELRLDERLALLLGHDRRDLGGALAQEVGSLAHDLVALEGGDPTPAAEALLGRGKRTVEIGALGMRDAADRLGGGGVEDRDRSP